jgi:hypothetical protein
MPILVLRRDGHHLCPLPRLFTRTMEYTLQSLVLWSTVYPSQPRKYTSRPTDTFGVTRARQLQQHGAARGVPRTFRRAEQQGVGRDADIRGTQEPDEVYVLALRRHRRHVQRRPGRRELRRGSRFQAGYVFFPVSDCLPGPRTRPGNTTFRFEPPRPSITLRRY